MERTSEPLDVIELGAISADTQGNEGRPFEGAGLLPVIGLSDD